MTFLGMPEWMSKAQCATLPPEHLDHPYGDDLDEDEAQGDWQAAKFIRDYCHACPVLEQCTQYATDNKITSGVWGGYKRVEN